MNQWKNMKRLTRDRDIRNQRRSTETTDERVKRLNHQNELKRDARLRNIERSQERSQETNTRSDAKCARNITENVYEMLQRFRHKVDNIQYKSCPVCNERIPLMSTAHDMCRRCYMEK